MSATLPEVRPGSVVAYWDGGELAFALVVGEEKERLCLIPSRGREQRVRPSRIVLRIEGPEGGGDVRRVAEIERGVRDEVERIDVPLLWQIVTESDPGAEPVQPEQLADLACGSISPRAQAAVLVALSRDGLHFVRRPDGYAPRSGVEVEALRDQRERLAKREDERIAVHRDLAAAARGEGFVPTGSPTEREYLEALESLALDREATPEAARQTALRALEASGLRWDRPHEGAFLLLRKTGRFSADDENLQVHRYGLHTEFPEEVLRLAALRAAGGWLREGRRDLTSMLAFSIDGPHTKEIDDLLSAERAPGGGFRLGIHIADPTAFVFPEDELDREAQTRGLTHYMPDLRLTMLPEAISEQAASLVPAEPRPALSFAVEVSSEGRLGSWEIFRSVVRSAARLDYDECDRISSGEAEHPLADSLANLIEVGRLLREGRARAGALILLSPEAEVFVGADGQPRLERLPADSPSRCAVSESMILAGALAARFCSERSLAVIYRRQAAPLERLDLPADGAWDAVLLRRARRALRRAETGLEPGIHAGLGLDAYAQVSSPLRRFQDLAIHRQIVATLAGGPPVYDAAAMRRIAASSERAELEARRAEQAANEYWILRYLEAFTGRELDAVVVAREPRPVIQLVESLWEQPLNGIAGIPLGARVSVLVQRVNPRAGLLSLRFVRALDAPGR